MKRLAYSALYHAILITCLPFALLCSLFVRAYMAFSEEFDRRVVEK